MMFYKTPGKRLVLRRFKGLKFSKRLITHGFTDIQDETRRKVAHPIVVFDPDEHLSVDKSRRIGKLEAFVAEKLQ